MIDPIAQMAGERRFEVIIDEQDNEDVNDVFVSVNGFPCLIKRGFPVVIREGILNVLNESETVKMVKDPETGEDVAKTIRRFAVRIIREVPKGEVPQAEELLPKVDPMEVEALKQSQDEAKEAPDKIGMGDE